MLRHARTWACLAVLLWVGFSAHMAMGYPAVARSTGAACASCHANPAGGPELTDAGKAYQADSTKVPEASEVATYVGSKKCRMCHSRQYKAWAETKHASALANLEKADEKTVKEISERMHIEITGSAGKTDDCVQCHVTGFKLAGGYPTSDSTRNASLAMVSCEACHGPGSKHVAASRETKKTVINHDVSAKMCMQCHVPAMSPKFDFATWKTKIHPVESK